MIRVYGIRNCDTIRKTLNWFSSRQVETEFIDYRKTPPDEQLLRSWLEQLDWEQLVNRRGTTWRKLTDEQREGINQASAIELMIASPSLIKRPVIDQDGTVWAGFDETYLSERVALNY